MDLAKRCLKTAAAQRPTMGEVCGLMAAIRGDLGPVRELPGLRSPRSSGELPPLGQ